MIIEYRRTPAKSGDTSIVLRTYKDVNNVETTGGSVTYLTGVIPAEVNPDNGDLVRWAQSYLIAAIKLAPGEYLERVDVPRD